MKQGIELRRHGEAEPCLRKNGPSIVNEVKREAVDHTDAQPY